VPNLRVEFGRARRNIGTPSDMRGPGAVPGLDATESAMDELADELKIDPVQLRVLNEPKIDEGRGIPFSLAIRTAYGYTRTFGELPLLMDKGHLSIRKKISTSDDELETPTKVWTTRCNAGALRRAGRRLQHMYDTILAPTGLKQCQYGILSALHARGAALPSVQELAEELVLDRSTLGQNLRPLERDNFVTLLTDPRDRRVRLIALTKLGIAKVKEAKPYSQRAQERFEEVFGVEEAAKLRSVLLSIAYDPELGKTAHEGK
jgi:DNA-binding MarR family transcriptional regulator